MRYVITLDTDTQLPRDAARKLVATMAHPLNRPRIDGRPESPRVVGGYGILQPRVGVSLAAASRSRFARLFAGDAGIDPYTRAVSDVYQDLFGEGSFIGKGIYDVDALRAGARRAAAARTASSATTCSKARYARSGLVSDVELVEDSPVALRRRRQAPPPLDARRLADRRVAAAARADGAARGGRRAQGGCARPQSAVGAVAAEDPRQPAAQPRAGVR